MSRTMNLLRTFYPLLISQPKEIPYLYYTNQNDNLTTSLYYGSSTSTNIPLSIQNVSVDTIGATTFCYDRDIETVTIPSGITTIE